ncbi:MAG TPA: MBL fold metallo-hydrolase [Actinomycetota bacterium]
MEPITFPVAPGLTAIDTFFGGRERYTAAYLLEAREPTLVETGPTHSVEPVRAGLARLGVGAEDLANIVLTHIHLDHAGGVGRLSAAFPRATVWVHERGAPHLADPAKLVASATRLYGEADMARLFGPVDPVPEGRLRTLADRDRVALGDRELEVLYTPGHASHQVALVDSHTGAVFTGDALGIHLPDLPVLRPATPPPDVDVEAGVESIERIRSVHPSVLLFAHFGPIAEVDRTCDVAIRRLRDWSAVVGEALSETDDLEEITRRLVQESARDVDTGAESSLDLDALEERLGLLSSIRANAQGLIRYWKKRREREGADPAVPGIGNPPPRATLSRVEPDAPPHRTRRRRDA